MNDHAHELTDKELALLEWRIRKIYREAAEDMSEKIDDYFSGFEERDKKQKALVDAGKLTLEQYTQWRLAQIGRGKRMEALRDQLAERMTDANEVAAAYINDTTPGIYSLNRNYAAYTIEQVAGNVGFDIWDESTVRRLIVENPISMPYYPIKRAIDRNIDLAWGQQQITRQITTGILQGESIGKIANRLQEKIPDMNRVSAVRAARTAMTSAQNAGRMDSYVAAQKMGIKLRREWVATLDNRTRHAHAILDGQKADIGKPFEVEGQEIMFPGDPHAHPSLVYNCRCTLIADVEGVDMSDAQRRARNPETGRNELISNMTYQEWEAWKKGLAKQSAKNLTPQGRASSLIDVTDEYKKTATPSRGAVEYDTGYKIGKHQEEIRIANFLHDTYGGDIKLLSESDELGVKIPDYNWRGKLWELKTTSTLNATDSAVRKAIKQIQENPGGIILDYADHSIDLEALISVISKRVVRCELKSFDILMLSKGYAIKVLRYKK